jgi:ABC-type glutathione transport system ATPase component
MTGSVAAPEAGRRGELARADAGRAGPGAAADPLLTLSGLSVSFGRLRALDDVNLSVRTGELVALAGFGDGAGKTTWSAASLRSGPGQRRGVLRGRHMPPDQAAAIKRGSRWSGKT